MSQDNILISDASRISSDSRSRTVNGKSLTEHYQRMAEAHVGVVPLPLRSFLKTSADSIEMAVNGSSAAVSFDLAPADPAIYRVKSLILSMSLASAATMTEFGDIAALTNGLTLQMLDTDEAEIVDLLGGQPLKSNNDIAGAGWTWSYVELSLTYSIQATFTPAAPIRIEGGDGERLRCVVQDDLSALTRMRLFADGWQEDSLS